MIPLLGEASRGPDRGAYLDTGERFISELDYWRLSSNVWGRKSHYKEWVHFSILAEEVDLLVNFSLMELWPGGRDKHRDVGRLAILHRDPSGRWDGDVEQVPGDQVSVRRGDPDIVLGPSSSRLVDGVYHIEVVLPDRGIFCRLRLEPAAQPVIANNIKLNDGDSINWLVVPRLRASGELKSGGQAVRLSGVPAYHDRNWGGFCWGGPYAWEWATILPADDEVPWSLVYSRISNGLRDETLSKSLILWRDAFPHRKFYARDLSVEQRGLLRCSRPLVIPRLVALLSTGSAADVPRRMSLRARAYRDELRLELELTDFAQIGVPNDGRHGVSMLTEAKGSVHVSGCVGGEKIRFDGRVHAEFNQPGA